MFMIETNCLVSFEGRSNDLNLFKQIFCNNVFSIVLCVSFYKCIFILTENVWSCPLINGSLGQKAKLIPFMWLIKSLRIATYRFRFLSYLAS